VSLSVPPHVHQDAGFCGGGELEAAKFDPLILDSFQTFFVIFERHSFASTF
jgi:hypothetical protein